MVGTYPDKFLKTVIQFWDSVSVTILLDLYLTQLYAPPSITTRAASMSLTPLGLGSFKYLIVLKYLLNSVLLGLAKITQP